MSSSVIFWSVPSISCPTSIWMGRGDCSLQCWCHRVSSDKCRWNSSRGESLEHSHCWIRDRLTKTFVAHGGWRGISRSGTKVMLQSNTTIWSFIHDPCTRFDLAAQAMTICAMFFIFDWPISVWQRFDFVRRAQLVQCEGKKNNPGLRSDNLKSDGEEEEDDQFRHSSMFWSDQMGDRVSSGNGTMMLQMDRSLVNSSIFCVHWRGERERDGTWRLCCSIIVRYLSWRFVIQWNVHSLLHRWLSSRVTMVERRTSKEKESRDGSALISRIGVCVTFSCRTLSTSQMKMLGEKRNDRFLKSLWDESGINEMNVAIIVKEPWGEWISAFSRC